MQRTRLNVAERLEHITEAQKGYFTRAQADVAGVADFELDRAIAYRQATRLDTGIYRLVGAPVDPHERLWIAWLRLTPDRTPRQRTQHPDLWVSHRSAAIVHGLGDYIADVGEFISTRRRQPRFEVKITTRSKGLDRTAWVVRDEFAVTNAAVTFGDLARSFPDGGHLGRYAADAVAVGAATIEQLQAAAPAGSDVGSLMAIATK